MANHLDQAVVGLKKADQYINHGISTLPDLASEYLTLNTSDAAQGIEEYRALLKEYVQMEQDSNLYTNCLEQVRNLIRSSNLKADEVTSKLDELYEKGQRNIPAVSTHQGFKEFERVTASAIGESQDEEMPEGEDLMVQEETQTLKCPYTGKQMVDPVKNTNCGHSYDKEGISLYIKQRGKRAKCPVSGCVNQSYITQRCLVADNKLKKEIEKRNKQAGR